MPCTRPRESLTCRSGLDYTHQSRTVTPKTAVLALVAAICLVGSGLAADGGEVLVGRIDGEINLAESAYVKRLVERAEAEGAAALAIELNTFGGRLDAAVAIRDKLLDADVDTVVFINKRAISAGALISLACTKIVISPGGTIGAATPVMSAPNQQIPAPVEEKYLSYFRQEMRVTAEARGRNGDIAAAMVDPELEVPGISEEGKLLTLTTTTAVEHGIADAEAEDLESALAAVGFDLAARTVERSWAENLAAFLTSQPVASLLFLGMMVLGYLELQTPGFGAFGAGALVCVLLLYFSHYLVNLAGFEEVLLFVLGVVLLLVELLVLPGFGIAGVLGLLAILASAVLLLMAGDWSDFSFENPFSVEAFFRVLVTTAVAIVAIASMMRFLPSFGRTRVGTRLVLDKGLTRDRGYVSHESGDEEWIGRQGVALTALRPSGKASFDGRRMNVETEGDFVVEGETVEIVSAREGRLVVKGVQPS
jgi:membrane-bound serine protease (ClpP class)